MQVNHWRRVGGRHVQQCAVPEGVQVKRSVWLCAHDSIFGYFSGHAPKVAKNSGRRPEGVQVKRSVWLCAGFGQAGMLLCAWMCV